MKDKIFSWIVDRYTDTLIVCGPQSDQHKKMVIKLWKFYERNPEHARRFYE